MKGDHLLAVLFGRPGGGDISILQVLRSACTICPDSPHPPSNRQSSIKDACMAWHNGIGIGIGMAADIASGHPLHCV